MLVIEPIAINKVWGTEKFAKYLNQDLDEKTGAINSVIANENMSSKIINSPYLETTLYEVVKNHSEDLGLPKNVEFPFIIAFTGADEDLSIQVHPTDRYAQENENKPVGKSESWIFIDPPKKGWIYSDSVIENKNKIEELIIEGKYEEVVGNLPVEQDDLVYVPAGTLHALTAGSFVYEIQQSTDVTYRLYDYDRLGIDGEKRELHLQQALETLDVHSASKRSKLIDGIQYEEKPYILERKKITGKYKNPYKIMQVITNLSDDFFINKIKIKKGQSVIIHPEEQIIIEGSSKVVIATPKIYWI